MNSNILWSIQYSLLLDIKEDVVCTTEEVSLSRLLQAGHADSIEACLRQSGDCWQGSLDDCIVPDTHSDAIRSTEEDDLIRLGPLYGGVDGVEIDASKAVPSGGNVVGGCYDRVLVHIDAAVEFTRKYVQLSVMTGNWDGGINSGEAEAG